jgi:hypothetical protein
VPDAVLALPAIVHALESAPAPALKFDPVQWWEQVHEHEAVAAEHLVGNKLRLFDALAALDITSVIVSFDGYGDSGQIEHIAAQTSSGEIELPTTQIELAHVDWAGNVVSRQMHTLTDGVESLAYTLLADKHGGWENNEGAFGDFTFDVAERTISLSYHERYEATEHYAHIW